MAQKLTLSTNKKLAGVCGGVADYLNLDATLVRIIWLILVLCFGVGVIAYIICWILMPRA